MGRTQQVWKVVVCDYGSFPPFSLFCIGSDLNNNLFYRKSDELYHRIVIVLLQIIWSKGKEKTGNIWSGQNTASWEVTRLDTERRGVGILPAADVVGPLWALVSHMNVEDDKTYLVGSFKKNEETYEKQVIQRQVHNKCSISGSRGYAHWSSETNIDWQDLSFSQRDFSSPCSWELSISLPSWQGGRRADDHTSFT